MNSEFSLLRKNTISSSSSNNKSQHQEQLQEVLSRRSSSSISEVFEMNDFNVKMKKDLNQSDSFSTSNSSVVCSNVDETEVDVNCSQPMTNGDVCDTSSASFPTIVSTNNDVQNEAELNYENSTNEDNNNGDENNKREDEVSSEATMANGNCDAMTNGQNTDQPQQCNGTSPDTVICKKTSEEDSNVNTIGNTDTTSTMAFPLLPGEEVLGSDPMVDGGTVTLTNYRLYFSPQSSKGGEESRCPSYQQVQDELFINVPIGVIDSVEVRDNTVVLVYTKYIQSFVLSFLTGELANVWHKRLTDANQLKVENSFCFKFAENCQLSYEYNSLEMFNRDEQHCARNPKDFVVKEFDRMGFDKNWKICELNKEFKFTQSYPQYFVVPNDMTEKDLESVANFRFSRRIPAVVWRSQKNGCVIARSSQPVVGWLGWRSSQDERLLQKIVNICNKDVSHYARARRRFKKIKEGPPLNGIVNDPESTSNGHVSNGNGNAHIQSNGNLTASEDTKLLILDARSFTAALANRAMGGGCEYAEYYTNCEIQFMGLANIHNVRKSFHSLRYICEASQIDQPNWFTQLDNTKWFHNLSAILKCSLVVVDAITIQERPVLVHCSDGWDRTPQLVSLAQLMLDPFYRSVDGFKTLIEREWLQFGHKFADRCRSTTLNVDLNERCPVFLQWLDCVHQLLRQFPTEFEFNEHLLVKLVHHTYSGLFGTFTCNNVQERINEQVYEKTVSFWAYLENEKSKFINYLYMPKQDVLRVSSRVKDLLFWNEIYVPVSSSSNNSIIPNSIDDEEEQDCVNRGIFVARGAEQFSECQNSMLNEASIDESKIDLHCITQHMSQPKYDLNRAASFESLTKIKFNDSPISKAQKISAPNPPTSSFDNECRLRVKHLSDTCLYDPNEIPNDRDRFLSPSRDDLNDERPASEKISDDSSCDDNASTKDGSRKANDERFSDGGGSPKPNPAELFDIDGEFVLKDKSNTQLQQMINYHKKMIQSLSQQLGASKRQSRAHKVYSPEVDRTRKSIVYKPSTVDLIGNVLSQFKPNGYC